MAWKVWYLVSTFLPLSPEAAIYTPDPGLSESLAAIHKVHMVGGESRVSLKPFARRLGLSEAETRAMFAATGFMACGIMRATVQLSGRRNLVTTAAHAPMYPNSCRPLSVACEIKFPFSSKPDYAYKIEPGSWKDGGCSNEQKNSDWAVFELDAHVDGVTPYEIPPADHYVKPPQTVLKVAAAADNFSPTEGEEQRKHNYNFEVCQIRDRNIFSIVSLHTDCDAGGGTSGAAELVLKDKKYYLTSISVAYSGVRPSGSDYDPRTHFTMSVAVEGDFLAEIRRRLAP